MNNFAKLGTYLIFRPSNLTSYDQQSPYFLRYPKQRVHIVYRANHRFSIHDRSQNIISLRHQQKETFENTAQQGQREQPCDFRGIIVQFQITVPNTVDLSKICQILVRHRQNRDVQALGHAIYQHHDTHVLQHNDTGRYVENVNENGLENWIIAKWARHENQGPDSSDEKNYVLLRICDVIFFVIKREARNRSVESGYFVCQLDQFSLI